MVLDSDGIACQKVNFNIGASTTSTRSWDIYVTQYTCGQEDLGGPPGCLQYYTSTTGLVKKYDHSPIKIRKGFHSCFDKIQSFALQFRIPNELHRSCSSTSFYYTSAKPKLQCVCPEVQRHVLHMLGFMVLWHQHGFLWIVHLCRWQRRSSINGNFMYLGLPSCKYRVSQ